VTAQAPVVGGEPPHAARVLDWDGCFNVRDLGGLSTKDGHRLRWGALVRSDIPSRLTEKGRAALLAHGVGSIVDLRFAQEVEADRERYPFRDPAASGAPAYFHVPFAAWDEGGPDPFRVAAYEAATTRDEIIRLDLDLNRPGIAAAVTAIADAPPGGVLIHCHAGKDRTGIVVALVLALLDVADSDIADDYALTAATLTPLVEEWLDSLSDDPSERQRLVTLAWPTREAMLAALTHLRDRYGSASEYLAAEGVSPEQIQSLRDRLLEPAGG
jgi:protein tyrosine/serine phosphatase